MTGLAGLALLALVFLIGLRLGFKFGRAVGAQDERTAHVLSEIDTERDVMDEAEVDEHEFHGWYGDLDGIAS